MSPGRIECLTDAHAETGAALFSGAVVSDAVGKHRCSGVT